MEPAENTKNLPPKTGIKHFPKTHIIAAGGLAICLSLLFVLFPSKDVEANRRQALTLSLDLPTDKTSHPNTVEYIINSTDTDNDEPALTTATKDKTTNPAEESEEFSDDTSPLVDEILSELEWTVLTVKHGDNLSLLFHRAGLSNRDVYEFTNSTDEAKSLKKIFPGHQLAFHLDKNGKLDKLRHIKNKLNSQLYSRTEDGFTAIADNKTPDIQVAYREAKIENSLVAAAMKDGVNMDINVTMELANIFGWDIDFALDIRKGDSFKVLYEEKFLDGERIGYGDILAAEFINQGKSFRAVRYLDDNGKTHYFTPDGKSMRKDFLRAPLDFRRISSNFNPRRLHPISKRIKPHRGTDYAANRGTPVWAPGDGKVIASSYSKANGNYVIVQHNSNIQTKYLHLHKRYVKKGQRVTQKQTIGTVGSTGYSTAPHLHYEFLVNGVHRNPRTIVNKLPKAKSIADAELVAFKKQAQPIIAQLDKFHQSRMLALIEPTNLIN
ncbi:MAG: peptidoglycan DD-metalloendopeptidase family protein [Cellvibrionaceae bacterium]